MIAAMPIANGATPTLKEAPCSPDGGFGQLFGRPPKGTVEGPTGLPEIKNLAGRYSPFEHVAVALTHTSNVVWGVTSKVDFADSEAAEDFAEYLLDLFRKSLVITLEEDPALWGKPGPRRLLYTGPTRAGADFESRRPNKGLVVIIEWGATGLGLSCIDIEQSDKD
jgi:hypothetical protein